jgi:hypothetical protein
MPTLRPFFNYVVPGFLSSSNGGSSKTTSGRLGIFESRSRNAHEIQSLGSTPSSKIPRNQYTNFDDENDFRLQTLAVGGAHNPDVEQGDRSRGQSVGVVGPNVRSRQWSEDSRSDKGFIQTKTTQVTYSSV